jgi:hypothetical protein
MTKKIHNIYDKFDPVPDKEYILTDSCYFQTNPTSNYNPYDKTRSPHGVQLVDIKTGTVVNLLSGSIIKVIKSNNKKK